MNTIYDRWIKMMERKKLELGAARELLEKEESKLTILKTEMEGITEAIQVVQAIAAEMQSVVHEKISNIVTLCLASVFDEPYKFHIHFDKKRNRTEARIVFTRDGQEFDPKTECGGGVVDVAAFAMRLPAIILKKPTQRRLIVLDEPFRFVSKKAYTLRLKQMLERLATEFKIQFLIITHESDLQSGSVFNLEEM